jgi:protein-tyrosine phosphatase
VIHGILFVLLAASLAWLAISHGGIWLLLAWPSLSLAVLACGYFGWGAKASGKRADGDFHLWARVLHAPYRLFAKSMWRLVVAASKEAAWHDIASGLTVGRRLRLSELPSEIDFYVDLTSEFEDPSSIRALPGYSCLPILDASTPSYSDLQSVLRKIEGKKVLLHCAQGHGRTGLVALFVLADRRLISSIDEGLKLLQSRRPGIRLSRAQRAFAAACFSEVLNRQA